MSTILPAAQRTKLAQILALLASDKDGERVAAALAACRLVKASGLTWKQILDPPAIEHRVPELGTWRQSCRTILDQHSGSLRAWELVFIRDLPKFRRLSTKQRYVLKEIADRVLNRGAP